MILGLFLTVGISGFSLANKMNENEINTESKDRQEEYTLFNNCMISTTTITYNECGDEMFRSLSTSYGTGSICQGTDGGSQGGVLFTTKRNYLSGTRCFERKVLEAITDMF